MFQHGQSGKISKMKCGKSLWGLNMKVCCMLRNAISMSVTFFSDLLTRKEALEKKRRLDDWLVEIRVGLEKALHPSKCFPGRF